MTAVTARGTGVFDGCQRPTMRWCLVLVVLLGLLVAGIAKVATRERGATARRPPTPGPPVTEPDDIGAGPERAADPPRAPRRPRPRLPLVEQSASRPPGIAMLHGHVRMPAGWPAPGPGDGERGDDDGDVIELADIAVVADDGVRSLTATADKEGKYAFHLPPGLYTLSAAAGPWVTIRTDVIARGGTDREVDLQLAMGATISGQLRGATDDQVSISARPTGAGPVTRDAPRGTIDDDRKFMLRGLIPGHRYDLTVIGEGLRTVKLADVMAPAAGLDVRIEPRATIRGAIGFRPGDSCPIDQVVLRAAARETAGAATNQVRAPDEAEAEDIPDGACAFELSVPDDVTHATVVATGDGWHLEEPVDIPSTGDPPPVCLNPPCANPSDVAADVVVEVGGPGRIGGMLVCLTPSEPRLGATCITNEGGRYVFERRPIGATLIVRSEGGPCLPNQRTITVQRGDNLVELACPPGGPGPGPSAPARGS